MATDSKRSQKALAKKAPKRKEKAKRLRARVGDGTAEVQLLARAPVHECLVPERLFEKGIGNVIVSRRLPIGEVAAGVFLIDAFCLGVKSAFLTVVTATKYAEMVEELRRIDRAKPVEPSCAKKLIEGAAAYARDLGLAPHPDYRQAKLVLVGIDAEACPIEFTYGKSDGKPLYVPGFNDTSSRQREILEILARRCGPGGFEFVAGIGT